MFNFPNYLKSLTLTNNLCKANRFTFGTCSGSGGLQDAITNLRKFEAFILADTVTSGGTVKKGGAWYQRRTYTFFVIKKAKSGDETNREETLNICREIRRQFLSRILYDQVKVCSGNAGEINFTEKHISFDLTNIPSTEYTDLQLDNCTGLYVMINADEPINLAYEPREWD